MAPGREGPVLFGDESSGYVFSYIFQVKDAQVGHDTASREHAAQ